MKAIKTKPSPEPTNPEPMEDCGDGYQHYDEMFPHYEEGIGVTPGCLLIFDHPDSNCAKEVCPCLNKTCGETCVHPELPGEYKCWSHSENENQGLMCLPEFEVHCDQTTTTTITTTTITTAAPTTTTSAQPATTTTVGPKPPPGPTTTTSAHTTTPTTVAPITTVDLSTTTTEKPSTPSLAQKKNKQNIVVDRAEKTSFASGLCYVVAALLLVVEEQI